MMALSAPVIVVRGIEDWDGSVVQVATYAENAPASTSYRESIYYCARLGVVYHDSIDSAGSLFPLCDASSLRPRGSSIPLVREFLRHEPQRKTMGLL